MSSGSQWQRSGSDLSETFGDPDWTGSDTMEGLNHQLAVNHITHQISKKVNTKYSL